MEKKPPRVLGAARTLSDAVSPAAKNEKTRQLIAAISSGSCSSFSLADFEQALSFYTNHNSNYTSVGQDEFCTLADEVLNNSIRSVLVYDDFSNCFGDLEVFSLSVAFQYNLSVEALTLSGVNVSDEAISMLCESLVHSRVNFIDFSNTPLEDNAGRSLAALAHVNPYLRTVIVDDTLIADDVLDEVDVACQFNQSNYEGSGGHADETLFNEAVLARLKHRLQQAVRSQAKKTHFCVAHLFGCCPNGDLCLYSHTLGSSGVDDTNRGLSEKITELFMSGGDWEEKLPPRPTEGASWRDPDDDKPRGIRLNLQRRREAVVRQKGAKGRRTTANNSMKIGGYSGTMVFGALSIAILAVGVISLKLIRKGGHS